MLRISQRPLTGSNADTVMFVDRRHELEHLERAARLDFNVLLLGDRGSGVTSLLQQHLRRLADLERRAFYVGAGSASDLPGLLEAIRRGVLGRRQTFEFPYPLVPDPIEGLRRVGADLEDSSEDDGLPIVVLDHVAEPGLIHELFGRYRDEVWEIPLRWVVAGDLSQRRVYVEPPADAFFDTEVTLGPFDDDAAERLVMTRLATASDEDEAVAARVRSQLHEIVERGRGNPRLLLAAARAATLQSAEESAATGRLLDAAKDLGSTEFAVVRHLLTFGPTSASDPELLSDLGTSRARATQVLRRLEDAGLVTASTEKSGVGRPRKLYTVRPDREVSV